MNSPIISFDLQVAISLSHISNILLMFHQRLIFCHFQSVMLMLTPKMIKNLSFMLNDYAACIS